MPCTSYPFSSSNSARYEPSWPVTPVINATLFILFLVIGFLALVVFRLFGPAVLPSPVNLRAVLAIRRISKDTQLRFRQGAGLCFFVLFRRGKAADALVK